MEETRTPQISRAALSTLPNPVDRHILGLLSGSAMNSDWMSYSVRIDRGGLPPAASRSPPP
jgi:hypothetical protein